MRFNVAGALALFLSVLSISALDVPPDHAPPEMLVVPPNVTIMTPRTGNSVFEKRIFDFRSAQSGFSGLRHILERQEWCPTGFGVCPNNPNFCCPLGWRCCGMCCDPAQEYCYGEGCCLHTEIGCGGQACCAKGDECCEGGSCCASGNYCVIINGKMGCCPIGQTCTPPPTCQDAGYSLCPDEKFCCPTGYQCYRDTAGNAKCRDPNPPPPPPPDTRTTQTYQVTSQAVQTGAFLGSETQTNVGAIAGGVVAGVIAVVVLVLALVFWRRRQAKEAPATNVQPPLAPPNPSPFNPAGAIPSTPNSGDPFLTPMGQHQNLGVSYFNGAPAPTNPPSGSNSGTGPYNASHYSGLPEPQQNKTNGSAVPMPMPRYDSTHPQPLPMTIVHSQQPQPQTPNARPWSGYTQSSEPYAENNNSQSSGWRAPANNEWTSPPPQTLAGSAGSPYAEQSGASAGSPPSTVNQPSSHLAQSPPGSPPGSLPLPDIYASGMTAGASGGSGLPPGAAPPMNV
ncbi:hypothetical protein FS749_004143 [Ceratobasidium sp. UAMH 11750]|nr:hypothetical protein FS749_004143 [Ceratobasidium sp. UAMH 11750]